MNYFKQLTGLFRQASPRHMLSDVLIILISSYFSLFLRVGTDEFSHFLPALDAHIPIFVACRLLIFTLMGVYTIMWRYVSSVDAVRIARASAVASALIIIVSFIFNDDLGNLPRSFYFIDAIVLSLGVLGARLIKRLYHEEKSGRQSLPGKRTLIYGAGNNGRTLTYRFRTDNSLAVDLVGFIDDDPAKQGLVIAGKKVLGCREDLARLIQQNQIVQVIIAVSNPSSEMLFDVIQATRPFNIRPRLISSLKASGSSHFEIYREVQLSDLLNRKPRTINIESLREMVHGKRVLVTGAGGSIGSEIARQIMGFEPNRLILLDHAEYNLYEIDKELRLSTHDTSKVVPLLVDLKDAKTLSQVMREQSPHLVFHAAAYKHVHLVESNPFPSILNNVMATQNLLESSHQVGVHTFVLISTDKAVNPAGVMGATKRVCELLTTAMALKTGRRYCSVRFGNVLGSSGSLIPLLQKQIHEGGPITITHQDMTRYFMLIPEAVSLVLQAAAISKPGDINVLKMGEPVRIVDVARSLLTLMGKDEKDVPIVFTGLRPGEKMFEELYIRGDELNTEHPDILTLPNGDSQMRVGSALASHLLSEVQRMIMRAQDGQSEALAILNMLVSSNSIPALRAEAVPNHS